MGKFITRSLILISFLTLSIEANAKEMAMIDEGKNVSIHYTLTVDGSVVDSSTGRDPLSFDFGNPNIPLGLQSGLKGLKIGDKKTITVEPEQGYGPVEPQAIIEIPRTGLPEGNLVPGTVLSTQGPNGEPLRAILRELKEETALLDFNHPLAGKTLIFEIEVIKIA